MQVERNFSFNIEELNLLIPAVELYIQKLDDISSVPVCKNAWYGNNFPGQAWTLIKEYSKILTTLKSEVTVYEDARKVRIANE